MLSLTLTSLSVVRQHSTGLSINSLLLTQFYCVAGKDPASELKAKMTLLEQNLETEKSERERERNNHRFEKDQLEREIHQKDDELGRIRTDITSQVSELEIHNQVQK